LTQEEANVLMMRVALILLAEARRRGDFGDAEGLAARASELTAELSGGASSPNPDRPLLQADLDQPDRVDLSIATGDSSASFQSLGFDGILYEAGTSVGVRAVPIDEDALSEEQKAAMERRRAEWQERMERTRQFTASDYRRTIVAPPQPGADLVILAAVLFADGFYVEHTEDQDPPSPEERDEEATMDAFLALRDGSAMQVEDDLGTEYFPSGAGGSGGVRVIRSSTGFAPAPPAAARVLRITTDSGTVELDLQQ
jgi:hypothetical protein